MTRGTNERQPMTNQVIPEAAVEAAADIIVQGDRAACECRHSIFDKHDVNPPCSTRRRAIRTARATLESAAPHMLAVAFDHGRSVQHYTSLGWSIEDAIAIHADKTPDNPYGGEGAGNQHFELHLSPCRAGEMGL